MTKLLITGKFPANIEKNLLNAFSSIQFIFAANPEDEQIRQADYVLAVGDLCPHHLNRLMGKFVTCANANEFQNNLNEIIKSAVDCQDIFLGLHSNDIPLQDDLTLGKCAVKKHPHRLSLIIIAVLVLTLIGLKIF